MNPTASEMPSRLSEPQRDALISLLADEDAEVFQTVRQKLMAYGHEAAEWLQPHTLSTDPLLRRRAKDIIHHFAGQDADNEFLSFCLRQGDELDLEDGVWLLARTKHPEINVEAYQAVLDGFANDLRERLRGAPDAPQLLARINQYLFQEQKFHGNEHSYYEDDNSYLNRVLDRRTGIPISLSTVYLLVARRLRLPVAGIGLPGHFICRYQSTTEEIFIDPFNQGRMMSKADCIKYLQTNNHGLHEEFLVPASPRRILMRMCSNLHQIYQQAAHQEDTMRLQRYLVALAR